MKKWTLTFFLMLIAGVLFAQQQDYGKNKTTNNKELIQVIDNFRMAIINNNAEKASSLLTDDARILETGGIETKEEYLSHHFHSDGKFLSAMERELKTQKVTSSAKTAWISTVSKMSGTYNDQDISIDSAELAVLVKTEDGWKISAVHWSSRSAN